MNHHPVSPSHQHGTRRGSRASSRTRFQACVAIILLQANLAFAAGPLSPASSIQAQAPASTQTPPATPEAPAANDAATPQPTLAQQAQQAQQQAVAPQQPFHVEMPRAHHNPFFAYLPSNAPELNLSNSPRLESLIRDGKLYISLNDAIALAIENNLDLAWFRYNFPIAETDIQRTKSGGFANGVNTAISQSTQGGFSSSSGGGGGSGGAGFSAGAGGIVTSTLGAGTSVPSFDPFLTFKGNVDHTTVQETNQFLQGTPTLKTNTIQGLANYSQFFPLGTNISAQYLGLRQTSNGPYNAINPQLYSNFTVQIVQPVLAGFGRSTNERFIRIAKRNAQINDLAFSAQVIATVTQVENIYWDLVGAYQDEQISAGSLGFAQQTLQVDQKQLDLKAIPAMQVMTDQSAVATAEGNLTVARATLRLNELLLKNALTKVDDPIIDEMPVVPLDLKGAPDPDAAKPIDALIADAEKNRPEVAIYKMSAEVRKQSLKDINSELLPSLNMYGFYSGAGTGGPKNPDCVLTAEQCSSSLPTGFPGMFQNIFNYSSPEYQVGMTLAINLRNRQAKADQFRAVLDYRQSQISSEQQQKTILFDVRNARFALEQAQAHVDAAQKTRDLAQRTFEITAQEQKLGAKSSYDTLVTQNNLAIAESTLVGAKTAFEKAKVDIERATGKTLQRMGVSIEDAKTGVVAHAP